MFESLLNFQEVVKKPYLMFFWAILIASVSILISAQLSYRISLSGIMFDLSGIFSVLFAIIPAVYFLSIMIKREELIEEAEIKKFHKKTFWEKHQVFVLSMLFFFAGLTVAYSAWSFALPGDFFQVQNAKINQIQGMAGALTQGSFIDFQKILLNNMQVFVFSFLFSLFFGAGAIFIITWNASILGVYIRQLCTHVIEIPVVGLGFIPHGVPEIAGYLCAGLAGGIISAAVMRKNSRSVLRVIIFDAMMVLAVGFMFILGGALIEVYL